MELAKIKFNFKAATLILLLFSMYSLSAQVERKYQRLSFNELSCGDICHYSFRDINTKELLSFNYDDFDENISTVSKSDLNEIGSICEENPNCGLKGQLYNVTLEYKLKPEYDMTETGYKKTGKRIMSWVVVNFEKLPTTSNITSNKFILKGKILVSEMQGKSFYRLLIKPDNKQLISFPEVQINQSYTEWMKMGFYKGGAKILVRPDISTFLVENFKEGTYVGIVGKESKNGDFPIEAQEIHILGK
jgi:hypothetical protein